MPSPWVIPKYSYCQGAFCIYTISEDIGYKHVSKPIAWNAVAFHTCSTFAIVISYKPKQILIFLRCIIRVNELVQINYKMQVIGY